MIYHVKVMKGGRITIPAALRRELEWGVGDTLEWRSSGAQQGGVRSIPTPSTLSLSKGCFCFWQLH